MIELKRCPFCGDEVEVVATGLYHWKYAIHHKNKTECILDANAFALPYEEEDAVRMWNTRADRKTENSSEIPNNFKWSVEYAKEMLDTMPCEECGHWEHGAGDHYYCALLEMRQKCYFELKGESTLMFANKPKTEPTISKMEQVDKDINVRSKDCDTCKYGEDKHRYAHICNECGVGINNYEPKDEPQTEREGE